MVDNSTWHTDIEYEEIPMHVSMFLVQHVPTNRDPTTGCWVQRDPNWASAVHPYEEGATDPDLMQRRKRLACNGQTAFADAAAALAALPVEEQKALEKVMVRRRLNADDEGWLAPLVRTCPTTGIKALHSPFFNSRYRTTKRPNEHTSKQTSVFAITTTRGHF